MFRFYCRLSKQSLKVRLLKVVHQNIVRDLKHKPQCRNVGIILFKKSRMRSFWILIFIIFFMQNLFSQTTYEESSVEQYNNQDDKIFGGYIRSCGYFFGKEFPIANAFAETSISISKKTESFYIFSDTRFRTGIEFNEYFVIPELKEAFITYNSKKFDISAGNKIISWGKTDAISPLNIVTPQNYFFLTVNPDDMNISNFVLSTKLKMNKIIVPELILIPFYKQSIYKFELFTQENFAEYANFIEPYRPEINLKNINYGIKTDINLKNPTLSLYFLNSYCINPVLSIKNFSFSWQTFTPSLDIQAKTFRRQSFGIDGDFMLGSYIFRFDAVYHHTKNYRDSIHIPNPEIILALALDKRIKDWQFIVQMTGKYVFDFRIRSQPTMPWSINPQDWLNYAQKTAEYELLKFNNKIFKQEKSNSYSVMFIVAKPFLYETLETNFSFIYDFTTKEKLINSGLTYKINDYLMASLSWRYLSGPENSLYNYSSKILNGIAVELKANF